MAKPKVFVTRRIPERGLSLLAVFSDADVWTEELPPSREMLLERIPGIDGLLCLLTDRIDGEIMDAAGPSLKAISNYAVGVDNIDISAATQRGIPVGNTPDILTDATADFAFALLMTAARRVVEGDRFVRAGHWHTWGPSLLLGPDVTGGTLGIIGFGRIGQAVAKRAIGFGMRVVYYDPAGPEASPSPSISAEFVDLDILLRQADFVTIHTPLTPETYHLIGQEALSKMKPTAVLINTARGPVVDPVALYEALKMGKIACAALDVTEPEPIALDSPLLELDNLIITPHMASASYETRNRMAWMAAQNLIAGLNGEKMPHCVNPEVFGAS